MGLYITKKKLPKPGGFLWLQIDSEGEVRECSGMTSWPIGTAIEVSGFGRLGDLDDLYDKMSVLSDNNGAHKDANPDDSMILRDSALYLIENTDAIIPASKEDE